MSNIFKAILLNDVSFRDLYGMVHTHKTGTSITVFQVVSHDCVSMDIHGRLVKERKDSFIGSVGKFGFDLERLEFQVTH